MILNSVVQKRGGCRDNNSDVDIGAPDVSYDNLAGEDLGGAVLRILRQLILKKLGS